MKGTFGLNAPSPYFSIKLEITCLFWGKSGANENWVLLRHICDVASFPLAFLNLVWPRSEVERLGGNSLITSVMDELKGWQL